jgi:YebC/PmpR family DNA-binding regulatory protein
MAGHSKWNNIKRKKDLADSKRASIFTKIGREISVAVKQGGGDPASNSKLRDAIAKAKANNVPNDNVERIIKKALGDADKINYSEITYEGYGPEGVAVMVKALTDNRNRTAGDLRHYFDKCSGNLGQSGSVSFLFEQKGLLVIENIGIEEDKILEDALIEGVLDITYSPEAIEILTEPSFFGHVRDEMISLGYSFVSADIEFIPNSYSAINSADSALKMQRLLDMLDDNEDVQAVFHNWDIPEPDQD